MKKFQVAFFHLELDGLFSFCLEELLEEVHLLLILYRPQMQSFLHDHHRWLTFLIGSPEWKAIPIWVACLCEVDPVARHDLLHVLLRLGHLSRAKLIAIDERHLCHMAGSSLATSYDGIL